MTEDDFKRLEMKIDMIIHHFSINAEVRRTDREIDEFIAAKVIKLEERRQRREAKHDTGTTSQEGRQGC